MKALRCDQCHYVEDEEGAMGWLHVEQVGAFAHAFGQDPVEGHFCSLDCVVAKYGGGITGCGIPHHARGAVPAGG